MRAIVLVAGFLLLVGCHKHRDADGPGERAGRGIDRAADKTGDALHRAAVKTDEAAHKAVHATGEAFEKAGQKLKGTPRATQPPAETKKPE